MRTLSTGDLSTLGSYKKLCKLAGMSQAEIFIERKIAEARNGDAEEVVAEESQMLLLLANIEFRNR